MHRGALISWLFGAAITLVCVVSCQQIEAGVDGASTELTDIDPAAEYRARLDEILRSPPLADARTSVEVMDCDSGEFVFAHNALELLNPASNLKILTSAVALDVLGPAFSFRTTFLRDGPFEGGVVNGNMYIRGEGDPELVYETVWKIVKELQAQGVTSIAGDLIADDSYFDPDRNIPDWEDGDADGDTHAYNAPLGALSFNFNTVAVIVRPGNNVGAPAQVSLETPTNYVKVVNRALTSKRKAESTLSFSRSSSGDQPMLLLEGRIPLDSDFFRFYRTVPSPPMFAATLLAELMKKEGIQFDGRVRLGKTPESAVPLFYHHSRPLDILLRYMNKLSSNFIAEQLLKSLGAHVFGAPGSTEKGLRATREYLQRAGLPWENAKFFNGSGLSYRTRVSAHQLVGVLCHEYRDFSHRFDFLASLPIAGVDGTMRRRMTGTPAAGIVRAKTGSVKGVLGFSGFLQSSHGRTLAFSFLVNDFRGSVTAVKLAQDRWANLLVSGYAAVPVNELTKSEDKRLETEPVGGADSE